MPFFSIILPSYNRSQLISVPIRSVLAQTFNDWELLVVDDGSTDDTREVALSFKDSRITYIWQPNAERSAARNNGISKAKGKYICFLDSDDYYLDNHLSALYKAIESYQEPKGMFVTDVLRNEGGVLIAVEHERSDKHPNNVCYIISAQESVIPGRVAIHREILEKFHFDKD